MKWIGCQIGARENYAIPQALDKRNQLMRLYTDIWFDNQSAISGLVTRTIPRLTGRFADIEKSKIQSFNSSAFRFEIQESLSRHQGWRRMYNRNRWFQDKVIHSKMFEIDCKTDNNKTIVFCYSYAARKILERAKYYGCYTVLGQIDGGLEEENLIANAVTRYSKYRPVFERAPEEYWQDWKQECGLADRIVVNSEWSRQLLNKAGIADSKIVVIPLMYDNRTSITSGKEYPERFTNERPLRVLFLGSLIIRKGIGEILEAVNKMRGLPVEFWFVGQEGVNLTDELMQNRQLHWIGPVSRSGTAKYYQMCDVFIFPTLSDGFGLTQLEAMAHGLPVIASTRCGAVVDHERNGIILAEISADHITNAIVSCLEHPSRLGSWSQQALHRVRDFSPTGIYPTFINTVTAAL